MHFLGESDGGEWEIQQQFNDLRGCAVRARKIRMLGCLVCSEMIGIRDRPMVGRVSAVFAAVPVKC